MEEEAKRDVKQYPISQEIVDMFDDAYSARHCRDRAIKLLCSTKKAIKFGVIAARKQDKAWELVYKLWPELKANEVVLSHNRGEKFVTEK